MTKEILIAQLVERGGISYEVNSTTPFAGVTLDYDENGQLQQRSNYKDGKSEGFSEKYYNNGQLEWRANFKDGKLNGLFELFDENGNLTKTKEYKNGELIKGVKNGKRTK